LALLSPRAAFEAVVIGNTFMTIFWLMAPSMYSSQLMSVRDVAPVPPSYQLPGMVVGSTLMAALNMTGLGRSPSWPAKSWGWRGTSRWLRP
jgi:hypothetical protein